MALSGGAASAQQLDGSSGLNLNDQGNITGAPHLTFGSQFGVGFDNQNLQGYVVPVSQFTGIASDGTALSPLDLIPFKGNSMTVVDGNGDPTTIIDDNGVETSQLLLPDASGGGTLPLTVDNGQLLLNGSTAGVEGPQGPAGEDGADGPAGASAYEVAVTNGFSGTESEWLASLEGPQGPTGPDGADGASAYEVAVTNGFSGTESQWLASLEGPQGPAGPDGADGNTVLNGSGAPTTEGVDGDFYIDTDANVIYGPKVAGSWPSTGVNLAGSKVVDNTFDYVDVGVLGYTPSTTATASSAPGSITAANGESYAKGPTVSYNGHSYTRYSGSVAITWQDAYLAARDMGGYLATLTHYDEWAPVATTVLADSELKYWIGYTRNEANDGTEGFTRPGWITDEKEARNYATASVKVGNAYLFGAWQGGQPNNSSEQGFIMTLGASFSQDAQMTAAFGPDLGHAWDDRDVNDSGAVGFVVEFQQ